MIFIWQKLSYHIDWPSQVSANTDPFVSQQGCSRNRRSVLLKGPNHVVKKIIYQSFMLPKHKPSRNFLFLLSFSWKWAGKLKTSCSTALHNRQPLHIAVLQIRQWLQIRALKTGKCRRIMALQNRQLLEIKWGGAIAHFITQLPKSLSNIWPIQSCCHIHGSKVVTDCKWQMKLLLTIYPP